MSNTVKNYKTIDQDFMKSLQDQYNSGQIDSDTFIQILKELTDTSDDDNDLDDEEYTFMYDAITDGVGWCTDDYLLNLTDTTDATKFALMLDLSKEENLYREEDCDDDDTRPNASSITTEEVIRDFNSLIIKR